jgi:hypothetical protein
MWTPRFWNARYWANLYWTKGTNATFVARTSVTRRPRFRVVKR